MRELKRCAYFQTTLRRKLHLRRPKTYAGKKISDVYPNLKGVCDIVLSEVDIAQIKEKCDVVFTALPHGASKEVIPSLYDAGVKIIDLSGDFRYNDEKVYEKWYGAPHDCPKLLKKSVYGLCELHRSEIKNADIIWQSRLLHHLLDYGARTAFKRKSR